MVIGMSLVGFVYGPLGTVLSELFPTSGALLRQLADVQPRRDLRRVARALRGDLSGEELRPAYVGYYLSAGSVLSLIGLLATRETKDERL